MQKFHLWMNCHFKCNSRLDQQKAVLYWCHLPILPVPFTARLINESFPFVFYHLSFNMTNQEVQWSLKWWPTYLISFLTGIIQGWCASGLRWRDSGRFRKRARLTILGQAEEFLSGTKEVNAICAEAGCASIHKVVCCSQICSVGVVVIITGVQPGRRRGSWGAVSLRRAWRRQIPFIFTDSTFQT